MTTQRELELLVVIEKMREALESCVRDDDGCIASAIRTLGIIKESEEN